MDLVFTDIRYLLEFSQNTNPTPLGDAEVKVIIVNFLFITVDNT